MRIFRVKAAGGETRDNGWTKFLDFGMNRVSSGVSMTHDSAMNLPVVYRCISLNSETIGAFPVDALNKVGTSRIEIEKPSWVMKPNDDDTWQDLVTMAQMSVEQDGNAFLLKATTPKGQLVSLHVLNPEAVRIAMETIDGKVVKVYKVTQTDGPERTLGANEILHIRGLTKPGDNRGLSPIALLREAIGLGLAVQEFGGRWFGEGAHLSGVIEVPKDAPKMSNEDAERLKESFTRKHGGLRKSHAVGILSGGAKFVAMSVNAEESQFLQTGRVTSSQLALAFGCPPNFATDAEGTKGYVTGVLAGKLMWLQLGLLTKVIRLETGFSSLMPKGYLKFNMRGFLRGSPEEENAYLATQHSHGALSTNEWRELLDRNPIVGGDEYINTLANFKPAA